MGSHSLLQGNLPDPGIEQKFLRSPSLAAGSLPLVPPGKTGFAPSPTLVISCLFDDDHPNRYEVISHYSSVLCFPDDS